MSKVVDLLKRVVGLEDEIDLKTIYEVARNTCAELGPEVIANECNLEWNGTNRLEVASGFASQTYPPETHETAKDGALQGFLEYES